MVLLGNLFKLGAGAKYVLPACIASKRFSYIIAQEILSNLL